jgi:hypothetical protein
MKLTPKKVIVTNIIVLLLTLGDKIFNYFYLVKYTKAFSDNDYGVIRIGTDLTNLYLMPSNDVLIPIPDYSIYIIVFGLIINLFFFYSYIRKK